MKKLDGRGAVVIGAGSGIGRGIALGLAAEGMYVLVADIDAGNADAVRDEIAQSGGDARADGVDAANQDSLTRLATAAEAGPAGVHLVVTTVGVYSDAPVTATDEATWAWFVELNLMATVRTVNTFLPLLRAHGEEAHLVVTSSAAGLLALPSSQTGGVDMGVYTVLKHAIIGYGEMLRHALAPEGIGVSVLCPGAVASNLLTTSARHRPDKFGGPLPDPMADLVISAEARKQMEGALRGPMPGEAVGPIVVRGVRENRGYILTHPEMAAPVRARQQQLLDDFAFFEET